MNGTLVDLCYHMFRFGIILAFRNLLNQLPKKVLIICGQIVGYIWFITESQSINWLGIVGAVLLLSVIAFQATPFTRKRNMRVLKLLGPSLKNIITLALAYAMVMTLIISLISLGLIGFSTEGTKILLSNTPWNITVTSTVIYILSFIGYFKLLAESSPNFR